jgi:hypothetical protein
MESERRYDEDEIAAIFERATEAQETGPRHLAAPEGMTLAQLQEIGREVGIPAELVADAAQSLDRPVPAPVVRSFLGLPIRVGRTVELGRRLTDDEWEQLVVDLRETFDARGTVRHEGSLRQWTNGNLQVFLEPGAAGHRLRIKTTKGSAVAGMRGGMAAMAGGTALAALLAATGQLANGNTVIGPAIIFLGGLGALVVTAARLPAWARERTRQMDAIVARLARPRPADERRLGGAP